MTSHLYEIVVVSPSGFHDARRVELRGDRVSPVDDVPACVVVDLHGMAAFPGQIVVGHLVGHRRLTPVAMC